MPSLTAPGARAGLAGDSPETRRSTSDPRSEVLRRVSGGAPAGLPPYPQEWAGRVAIGEGPEAGLLGEPTWAGAINRDSGNRQRSKAEAQPDHAHPAITEALVEQSRKVIHTSNFYYHEPQGRLAQALVWPVGG
jgi:hypothetical protein